MFVKIGKQRESRLFYIKKPEMLIFISYSQPGPLEARHHVPLQVPPEQEEEDPAVQQRGGRHGPKRNGVSWVLFVLFLLLEKSHEGKFISALDVGEVEKRKKQSQVAVEIPQVWDIFSAWNRCYGRDWYCTMYTIILCILKTVNFFKKSFVIFCSFFCF